MGHYGAQCGVLWGVAESWFWGPAWGGAEGWLWGGCMATGHCRGLPGVGEGSAGGWWWVLWGSNTLACYGAVQSTGCSSGAEDMPCTWQLLKTAPPSPAPGAAPSRQAGVCRPSPRGSGEVGRSRRLLTAERPVGIHSPPEPGVRLVPGCVLSLGSPVQSPRNLVIH